MDWRELIARFLPEVVSRFLFDRHPQPHPEPRILKLVYTGGGTHVTFRAEVVNEGSQRCRCVVSATVGSSPVNCQPPEIDLLVNAPTDSVSINVPRPELGDLIPEFNNDATLYGEPLRVVLILDDEETASAEWREHLYAPEENNARHEIQQRKWRLAKGEETEADRRTEWLNNRTSRSDRGDEPGRYIEL